MTTFYISPIGNDSTGAGTLVSPWQTMSKAVASSASGDTILCDGGNGNHVWVNQSFLARRVIGVYNGAMAVFDGANAGVGWGCQDTTPLLISNIRFQNATAGGFNFSIFANINSVPGNISFVGCIFNNLLANPVGTYYSIFSSLNANATISLISCLLWNCGVSGAFPVSGIFGTTVTGGNVLNANVSNCTLYSTRIPAETPSVFATGSINAALKNNIIWNNNGTPLPFGPSATFSGSNNDILGYTGAPSLPAQLSTDPLFVDAVNGDFRLRPTSPCIDAGVII